MFNQDKNFNNLGLNNDLIKNLATKLDINKPTKIQSLAIPHILSNRDVLIKSMTGSGKTLCFLLPIIHNLIQLKPKRSDGTLALIISPTRELGLQIKKICEQICHKYYYIVVNSIMGGERKKSEKARLRKGVNILIATPGRLLDHLKTTQAFKVNNLKYLVLDEADRLLDMGFEQKIKEINTLLQRENKYRIQTILVSATLDKTNQLADYLLDDPIQVGFSTATTSIN